MSVSAWKKRSQQTVKLPSGMIVEIKLPNVAEMILSGDFPNSLRKIALREINGVDRKELTEADLKSALEFMRYIVVRTVVSPRITEDDLDDLPQADLELLAAIARREVPVSAVAESEDTEKDPAAA